MPVAQGSDPRAGLIEVTTVGDCVDRAAQKWSHDAIIFPGGRATYPEFAARIDRFARAFIGLGIDAGDKVGIRMEQGVDYYAALVGAAKVGAVAVPVNVRFKALEISHVIINSDMTALIGSPDGGEVGSAHRTLARSFAIAGRGVEPGNLSLEEAPRLRHIIVDGPGMQPWVVDSREFDAAGDGVTPQDVDARRLAVRVRDTAVLMYTSGTHRPSQGGDAVARGPRARGSHCRPNEVFSHRR